YTPPELSGTKRSVIGKFSDIYSIGMTICRTLSEDENSFPNITDRLIDDSEFQSILNRLPIDVPFRGVLRRMTAINPEDRYQSLDDVERDLSRAEDISDDIDDNSKSNLQERREESSSPMFAIFGVMLSIMLASLGWYAYNLINRDRRVHHNTTTAVANSGVDISIHKPSQDNTESSPEPTVVDSGIPTIEDILEEDDDIEIIDTVASKPEMDTPTPTSEVKDSSDIEIVYQPSPTKRGEASLGIPIHNRDDKLGHLVQSGDSFNRQNVQNFLNQLIIASEENDIRRMVSFYDRNVDRYFSLSDVTHRDIYRDKVKYIKKWVEREYGLIDFKILRVFEEDGVEYCDVEKHGNYRVVSSNGRVASGVSRIFLRLKKTPHGFKIKSVYSIR
ncbi:MAG: hypothetical protein GXO06_02565, partial [Epsilonproteobacteria bacterium]|nr:hypothetical protein [Campylobacterota bacterium]